MGGLQGPGDEGEVLPKLSGLLALAIQFVLELGSRGLGDRQAVRKALLLGGEHGDLGCQLQALVGEVLPLGLQLVLELGCARLQGVVRPGRPGGLGLRLFQRLLEVGQLGGPAVEVGSGRCRGGLSRCQMLTECDDPGGEQGVGRGQLIAVDTENQIARDEFGNALGGIRLPELDVPIATYGGHNVVNPLLPGFLQSLLGLFCRLSGTVAPFDDAQLFGLYPGHGHYVSQYVMAANELKMEGFLLPEDGATLKSAAAMSTIGHIEICGLGFELALIVPAILWAYRRRRR